MQLTVINKTDGTVRVHKAGCKDIAKDTQRCNGTQNMSADTQTEVVVDFWQDIIAERESENEYAKTQDKPPYYENVMDGLADEVTFVGCTRGLAS